MPIKLIITHGDEPAETYTFERSAVLGRGAEADVVLADPSRVVSQRHAEVRLEGGAVFLADLGSKNGTHVGGRRLPSEQPVPLRDGDSFAIGDFSIEVRLEAAPPPDLERTVFAADFANPFAEAAERLAEALGEIRRRFAREAEAYRAEALLEALSEAALGGGDEAGVLIARALGQEDGAATALEAPPPAATPPPATSPPATPPPAAPPAFAAPEASAAPAPTGPAIQAADEQVDRLLEVALRVAARLVGIPWQFRHEFIGQTMVQTEALAALHEQGPGELRRYFLDPGTDPEELGRRATALEEAAEAVVIHQLAMLDGYRASAQEGARKILEELDPALAGEAAAAGGFLGKLPLFREAAALAKLAETHGELGAEDWSVAERRAFRPAFIKAYLARMTRRG